ncbi:MAG: TetR/AcrR family transcriptional regulator [Anaerolineales bacterium]|jgi:AcrR family transcriptional regulator
MNRHQKRKHITQNKLKTAALELLLEKGYDKLNVMDITDRADLGRGTFYIHFNDKEDIVWAIIEDGIREEDQAAHLAFDGKKLADLEYHGYVRMFKHAEKNMDLYRVMLGANGSSMLTDRVQTYLSAELKSEMGNSPIFQEFTAPAEVVAEIIIGSLVRLIIWWLIDDHHQRYSADEMASWLYQVLHHKPPSE